MEPDSTTGAAASAAAPSAAVTPSVVSSPPAPGAPVRLALIGGGPRGLGVLERLAASADLLRGRSLRIDVVEPHMLGAGRIWSSEESPLLLMNSRAADVTVHPDDTVVMDGPAAPGPSLAEWAEEIRAGHRPYPTAATGLRAEIDALTPDTFASRRVQSLYLETFAGEVLAALPEGVTVQLHRTVATGIERVDEKGNLIVGSTGTAASGVIADGPDGSGATSGIGTEGATASGATSAAPGTWRVALADGSTLDADLAVLSVGHTDARPTPARHELAAFARRHGGAYVPPSQARDADLSTIDAGQDVIVRGMGLAFVDLVSLLTEGRGGRFEPCPAPTTPGRLRYVASGEEPRLWVGSRRGVPYHSKVRGEGEPAGPRDLVHLTEENLRRVQDAQGRVRFRQDVLPLIAAEIARAVPGSPDPEADPDLAWLDDPLSWLVSGETWEPRGLLPPCDARRLARDAVVRHIENDLAERTVGDNAPARALFQVLLRITGALVRLVPVSRLHPESAGEHPGWWHSVFSFVDSGPPPHRLHQLLALERAGIVRFLGPRIRVTADEERGHFVAEGGTGARAEGTALIDAFLTEPTLADSTNPLLRGLVGERGRPAVGRESFVAPGHLEIDADQRVVAADGTPRPGLWAAGPWTSELPAGAFARPRIGAPVFGRNDALARQVLRAAARTVGTAGTARAEGSAGVPGTAGPAGSAGVPEPADASGAVGTARFADPSVRGRGDERPSATPSLGVVGPGRIGTAIARLAVRRGLDVRVAGRLPVEELHRRIPGARAVPPTEIGRADVVVLTLPLHVALRIDPAELAGAVVIDATNAWGELDVAALAQSRAASTSEALAAHLRRSRVVKTLNHIGYHDVEEHMHLHRAGSGGVRALAVAGDDATAVSRASAVLARMGFDPVPVGRLADGAVLQPDGSLFSSWRTRGELESALRSALVHREARAA